MKIITEEEMTGVLQKIKVHYPMFYLDELVFREWHDRLKEFELDNLNFTNTFVEILIGTLLIKYGLN